MNKSIKVNLTTRQIENLLFAACGGDIRTLHPTRARSLRYAVKALRKAKDAASNPHQHRASCHGAIGELLCGEL